MTCGDPKIIQTETLCPKSLMAGKEHTVTWLLVGGDPSFEIQRAVRVRVTLHGCTVILCRKPALQRPLL